MVDQAPPTEHVLRKGKEAVSSLYTMHSFCTKQSQNGMTSASMLSQKETLALESKIYFEARLLSCF